VISWGASVVIIGLMFKILHWQGGEFMIAIGLLTESFLFFILGIASMTVVEEADDKKASDINDLLSTAITPKVIERLSMGFQQFNKTVESVNQIAGSFNVTQNLIKEIEVAAGDVKKFRDNMAVVSTGFGEFNKSLQAVGQMAASTQGMMKDFETAGAGMKAFSKNMTDMNASFDQFTKTLAAINQMTASSQSMLKEFEAAAIGMRTYNKNITDLSKVYAAQLEAFKK
jgi:DNA repair ATPase RecN